MNLVVAMEEEFDITLNDEDIFEIINYKNLKEIIIKYIKQFYESNI